MVEEIRYFNWEALFSNRRRNLPHFCQEGVVYFVTFRLGDSIPASKLQYWRWQYEQWLRLHPPPHSEVELEQKKELGFRRVERLLDRGHGACLLKTQAAQDALEQPMRKLDGGLYELGDYIIMPNHVHVLVRPTQRIELGELIGPWRSVSAREINQRCGRKGPLWQEEAFDHIVRGPKALDRFRRYIQNNPKGLRQGTFRYGCGTLFEVAHPPAGG